MPSTTSTLLARFSTKLSKFSRLPNRLFPKRRRCHIDDLPITHSSLASRRERSRQQTHCENSALSFQAEEAAGVPAADTTTATNSSDEEVWSWRDSDEEDFSVPRTGRTSDTDLSGEEGWKEGSEPIKMRLRDGPERKVVIKEPHKGYCVCDLELALKALKEPEEKCGESLNRVVEELWGREMERERKIAMENSRAVFQGTVKRPLRQVALGDSDDGEDEAEVVVSTKDNGGMRGRHGQVASGDAWWKGL